MVIRQGDDMALSKELLEILACPKCKGQVHLNRKMALPLSARAAA